MPEFMVTQRRKDEKKDKEGKRRKANGHEAGIILFIFSSFHLCVFASLCVVLCAALLPEENQNNNEARQKYC
jgi:hypothetical protein